MKKLLAVLLAAMMLFAIVGCSNGADETPNNGGKDSEGLTLENIKLGFIYIGDASDKGYSYTHIAGANKMQQELGLRDDQIISKYNITEDSNAEVAINELIEAGCNAIFGTSFGYENYMLAAAAEHPEIEFFHASGYQAAGSGLPNMHNYFGNIYEARYLTGIAAGLKTKTNKLGYVTAMPFAECISGFTAFYLGAKSVNPDVTMEVMYTNSWNDPTKEAQVAQALIDMGCDVLGQHADSTATQTTAEANGVWSVGYNADMSEAAPNAVLTSAIWDWSQFLIKAVKAVVEGTELGSDFTAGLAEGFVDIAPLNEALVAEGTAEAIEAARQKILSGEIHVFDGPLVTVDGETVVPAGEYFQEPQSSPSWDYIIEGIHVNQ
ncbi:MAG: BMP family ABC transporter substrate-binding protein [Christensenellales bacterium]|jgi:basic membrane protein A